MAAPLERIATFLGVEPSERRSVALMTAHSFFMGCATVFFETAASATFLARFPSSFLPWVYIAAAGVNTFTGAVYARAQQRVSFARLMRGTLWFLFILVASVRAGMAASGAAWAAFVGLVSYRIVSSLTDLEYWAVASRIYDVRQAKRLFGLVGSGEVVARIAGSFSVPLLVRIGGVSNLIVLSATGLALCLVLLRAVLRSAHGVDAPPSVVLDHSNKPLEQGLGDRLREILASPYLSLVVLVAVLATFGKYFVDFAYLEQMSTLSKGEVELAGFLGLFNGVTQTLSLLTRLFVSRPLLNRFGIRVGVVVLPTLHAICSAATIACGYLLASPTAVFVGVIANQGVYKAFKHPIDNASFKVLYQPLKPRQRLAAQIAVEIIFSPIVVGLAGVVMLIFSAGMTYNPVYFSFVLLANFLIWTFAARAAGRRYAGALLDMLRRRIEGNVALPFDDATTLSTLRARLASDSASEVCAALDLLEKAGAPGLTEALVARVDHPSPEVRRYALERLVVLRPAALAAVAARLSHDDVPMVREVALRAASSAGTEEAVEILIRHLSDPEMHVRRAAADALFATGNAEAQRHASEAVDRFATHASEAVRIVAAQLAGDQAIEPIILRLIDDPAPNVRRAVLAAAGRARIAAAIPALIEHLRDARFAQTAANALAVQGEPIIALLEPLFTSGDRLLCRRLLYVYRLVGGPTAALALRRHLDGPDVVVRGRVVSSLDRLGWVAPEDDRVRLQEILLEDARTAAWTAATAHDVAREAGLEPLAAALEREVDEARERAFHMLALLHERVAVHRAAHYLSHGTKDRRAYALEVFDLLVDAADRRHVLPLLDAAHSAGRARLRESLGDEARGQPSVAALLGDILARPARELGTFTRALAAHAARSQNDAVVRAAAKNTLNEHPSVRALCAPIDEDQSRMLLIEKLLLLKTVPMFAKTSEELLGEIAQIVEEVEVAKGTQVFAKGDAGESMYIVVTGCVRIYDGDRTLSVLGEKEIFGELALLDPAPRSASAEAVEDARLFKVDGDLFAQLMAGSLDIVRGVLHVLCERLRKTSAFAGRL